MGADQECDPCSITRNVIRRYCLARIGAWSGHLCVMQVSPPTRAGERTHGEWGSYLPPDWCGPRMIRLRNDGRHAFALLT